MVDLIYGRGITDLARELPFYLTFFRNIIDIRLFHKKRTLYGSADIINVCNLHCSHCYWWLNREDENNELSVDDWRSIIRNTFKKQRLIGVTLVGGEPTMRPEVIDVFCQEMPGRVSVVTNGTFPLKR
ncbi:MAG: radical SAM protein, partial [Nitrososphaerota archaeon]